MPDHLDDVRLCVCGCFEGDHDAETNRCHYCPGDDCGGFVYDQDATLAYLISLEDLP